MIDIFISRPTVIEKQYEKSYAAFVTFLTLKKMNLNDLILMNEALNRKRT